MTEHMLLTLSMRSDAAVVAATGYDSLLFIADVDIRAHSVKLTSFQFIYFLFFSVQHELLMTFICSIQSTVFQVHSVVCVVDIVANTTTLIIVI